jgi:hypothetical protein
MSVCTYARISDLPAIIWTVKNKSRHIYVGAGGVQLKDRHGPSLTMGLVMLNISGILRVKDLYQGKE